MLAIIAAMPLEIRGVWPHLRDRAPLKAGALHGLSGQSRAGETALVLSGVGEEAARRTAAAAGSLNPRAMISWGFAGGADPAMKPGMIVLAASVTPFSGRAAPLLADEALLRIAWSARIGPASVVERTLATVPSIAGASVKAEAFGRLGAAAVDMESFWVAQEAARLGIPFLAVRAVTDTAHTALPDYFAFGGGTGAVSYRKLWGYLVEHPAMAAVLPTLALRAGMAARNLGRYFHSLDSTLAQEAW